MYGLKQCGLIIHSTLDHLPIFCYQRTIEACVIITQRRRRGEILFLTENVIAKYSLQQIIVTRSIIDNTIDYCLRFNLDTISSKIPKNIDRQ